MNNEVSTILEKIKSDYNNVDTILVFGSTITPEWSRQSDIDVFLIDDSFHDSRSEKDYDGVLAEFQEDNFATIKSNMEQERGNLLHRNLSTMIATSEIVSTKSPEKINELISFAKEILASAPNYNDEDIKMWRYSILDYLSKDIARGDGIAFYIDAHYVLQNALEMSLATHNTYMPQPKFLKARLTKKDPELLSIWQEYLSSTDLNAKLDALSKLSSR